MQETALFFYLFIVTGTVGFEINHMEDCYVYESMLVKRPLLITNDKVLTGFKESDWKECLL